MCGVPAQATVSYHSTAVQHEDESDFVWPVTAASTESQQQLKDIDLFHKFNGFCQPICFHHDSGLSARGSAPTTQVVINTSNLQQLRGQSKPNTDWQKTSEHTCLLDFFGLTKQVLLWTLLGPGQRLCLHLCPDLALP